MSLKAFLTFDGVSDEKYSVMAPRVKVTLLIQLSLKLLPVSDLKLQSEMQFWISKSCLLPVAPVPVVF